MVDVCVYFGGVKEAAFGCVKAFCVYGFGFGSVYSVFVGFCWV